MTQEIFKIVPAAHLFLVKEGRILLSLRKNTGYEDGSYSVPAGHVDADEGATNAIIREANEEIGILLEPQNLKSVHIMNLKNNRENVAFFFAASTWTGQVSNCEPDKCGDLSWFAFEELPTNIIPYVKQAIIQWRSGNFYSELGYEVQRVTASSL